MENTQLFSILDTLDNKELKLLKKWVASPFYNQRADVIQVLDIYVQGRKKGTYPLSKTQLFDQLYPNEVYSDHKVRLVMSFLNRQTEQFLINQKQQAVQLADKMTLLEVYRERGLEKPYKRISKEIEKIFDQTAQKNRAYYQLKYRFYQEQFEVEQTSNRYERKHNIQAISDNLDIYIFLEKIREGISARSHEGIASIKYDLGILEDLLIILQEKPSFLENPAIATYYAAYLTILHSDEHAYFTSYQQLLEKNESVFNKVELLELYTIAHIYLQKRFTQGETNYLSNLLVNYQRIIQLNLYEHKIPQYDFKNIITIGLKSKAYDWIEQFIVDFTPKLDKVYQNTLPVYAQASLAQRRGQYRKALQLLKITKFEDINHNLSARLLKVKIFFGLKDWEELQKQLKAFEIYVRRLNKIEAHKKYYLDFILFAQKVFRVNRHDKAEKEQLLVALKTAEIKFEKDWLITCLNKL